MTTPVSILIEPGLGPNCESTFTMAFYIPSAFQHNTPEPKDPDVFIEERPELKLFARYLTTYSQFFSPSTTGLLVSVLVGPCKGPLAKLPLWSKLCSLESCCKPKKRLGLIMMFIVLFCPTMRHHLVKKFGFLSLNKLVCDCLFLPRLACLLILFLNAALLAVSRATGFTDKSTTNFGRR